MQLTPIQRIVLQRYLDYQKHGPTFASLMRQSWRAELIVIIVSVLGAWVVYRLHFPAMSYFIVGLMVGALARDAGSFRRVVQIWPAIAQVLDWQRVEQALDKKQIP